MTSNRSCSSISVHDTTTSQSNRVKPFVHFPVVDVLLALLFNNWKIIYYLLIWSVYINILWFFFVKPFKLRVSDASGKLEISKLKEGRVSLKDFDRNVSTSQPIVFHDVINYLFNEINEHLFAKMFK